MNRRQAALAALLAALFGLQVPLCAAACSGTGTAGHALPAAADDEADPHPCHGRSEPVEEPAGDCGANCLHEAQAVFAKADASHGQPALAVHRIHGTNLTGCRDRIAAPVGSSPMPLPPDILLLTSTLII